MSQSWTLTLHAARLAIIGVAFGLAGQMGHAHAEEPPAKQPATFESVLETQTRATLQAVVDYIRRNPEAADVEEAHRWLFATATARGLEVEVQLLADEYLKRTATQQSSKSHARRVSSLGNAKNGKLPEALSLFQADLNDANIREIDANLDFGAALAENLQLQGDFSAVRQVYDSLSSRLFLNAYAREFCELRMRHLELAKQKAPKVGVTDLDGKAIDLESYSGKVVLIDFWATNCEPCLREFPAMKKLYEEYHDKGLEIVGISLDDERSTVNAFQQEFKLPWRLALSGTDRDETRRRYRADKVPTMYIVDQQGNMAFVDLHESRIRQAVQKLLSVGK